MNKTDLDSLTNKLIRFRDERNWQQFHTLKDLIISLNLEAAELLELTQWQNADDFEASLNNESNQKNLKDECADILLYLLLISEKAGIDLVQCANDKIADNTVKYPIEKSKGNAKKYTLL